MLTLLEVIFICLILFKFINVHIHVYLYIKGIPYSQALRLLKICSVDANFDKPFSKLEKWLMEKCYKDKTIHKQILRAREHFRNEPLEREKCQMFDQNLTLNITYYPAFENVRTIMEKLYILLTSNKEHKKVFPTKPIVGFQNGKSVKDFVVTAKLHKLNRSGRQHGGCGKKPLLVFDSKNTATTFRTEAC